MVSDAALVLAQELKRPLQANNKALAVQNKEALTIYKNVRLSY